MVEIDEEKMQRFAGRDTRLQARLREIELWYTRKREMYAEADAIFEGLTAAEERSLFGPGERKHPLQVLLWAMDQADSPVRSVARKWVAFTSFETVDLAPAMKESALRSREGVLALPAPGSAMAPIVLHEDPVEEPPQEVARMPRRSARLAPAPPTPTPRRSARLAGIDA
ncbi:hypothetical protein CFC21_031810 [Triticum aestivum]|uniref:DUF222 domain-containing protein n=2 Tax=Triticum aestivum TaxID=4565 RepID=A0A9R1EYB5_WHEAT|nr:hypothetical protein CFC21_031810 [Triticum aestivum]